MYINQLSFKYITNFIKDDPIFYNNLNIPQISIYTQLYYAVYRFSLNKNANSWISRTNK